MFFKSNFGLWLNGFVTYPLSYHLLVNFDVSSQVAYNYLKLIFKGRQICWSLTFRWKMSNANLFSVLQLTVATITSTYIHLYESLRNTDLRFFDVNSKSGSAVLMLLLLVVHVNEIFLDPFGQSTSWYPFYYWSKK